MALRIRPGLGLDLRARCHSSAHRFDSPRRLDRFGRGGRAWVPPRRLLPSAPAPSANTRAVARVAGFATYSRLSSSGPSDDGDGYDGHYHDSGRPRPRSYNYKIGGEADFDTLQDLSTSDIVSRTLLAQTAQFKTVPNPEEDTSSSPDTHDADATDTAEFAPEELSSLDQPLFTPQIHMSNSRIGERTPNLPTATLEPDTGDDTASSNSTAVAVKGSGVTELTSAGGTTLEIPDAVRNRMPLPGISNSVLVRRFEIFPHWRETLRSFRSHYGSWKLQQMLSYRRQEVLGRFVREDWNVLLSKFIASTPQRTPGGAWVKLSQWIELPAAAARILLGDVDDNIWEIYELTDCHIDAYVSKSDPEAPVTIFFSGDETSVNEAWAMMCKACQRHGHPIHQLSLVPYRIFLNLPIDSRRPKDSAPTLRPMFVKDPIMNLLGISANSTWGPTSYAASLSDKIHNDKRVSSMYSGGLFVNDKPIMMTRFQDVPLPTEWTRYTFCRYMNALVQAQISPSRMKVIYPNTIFLHQALHTLLDGVFAHAAKHGALSAASFRLGLKLMTRYGMSRKRIDVFFQNMLYGYQMDHVAEDARVWNLLLEPIIRTHNMDQFTGVIEAMGSHGAVPDRRTWQLFIQLVEHPMAKRAIMRAMHSKGLLSERKSMRIVANELSMDHALEACRAGLPFNNFMDQQEQRYGRTWLSQHSLGHTIEAFCRYGRFDDCLALLKFAYDNANRQHVYPNPTNWKIIVYHARLQDKAHALADAVASAEAMEPTYITAVFYENMLRLAWDARRPTLMSESWLAACARNKVTATIGVRMSAIFSWLIARMAGDSDALPFEYEPAPSPRPRGSRAIDWGPILVPPLMTRIAQRVYNTHAPPPPPSAADTPDAPPSSNSATETENYTVSWWRDRPALLAECISATRDLFYHEAGQPLGARLQEAACTDDILLDQWNANRSPDNAERLGITPLGSFAQHQTLEITARTTTPDNIDLTTADESEDGYADNEEAEIEEEFRRKFKTHMKTKRGRD